MKKILLILALLITSSSVSAQITKAGSTGVGQWETWDGANWQIPPNLGNMPPWLQGWLYNGSTYLTRPITTILDSSNFVWGATGSATGSIGHFRIKFNRQPGDCRRVFLQVAGDDIITGNINNTTQIFNNLNGASGQTFYVELTNEVVCGENTIYVGVNNSHGLYCYFLGILEFGTEQLQLSNASISHSEIKCGSPLNFFAPEIIAPDLYAGEHEEITGETYEWTGPNGFSSTDRNPSIPNPTAKHSGIYTVKIKKNCCEFILSINIEVPDCDKCIVNLETVRTNCNHFKFNISSDYVDIKCFQWQLDYISQQGSISEFSTDIFTPGSHLICYKYFGPQLSNPNQICCNEVCTTIVIPNPEPPDYDTIHYCKIPEQGSTIIPFYALYNPCTLYPQYKYHSTEKPGTFGISSQRLCNPNTKYILTDGLWLFRFYDDDHCLKKILYLTVIGDIPQLFTCSRSLTTPCGQNIDPQSVMPLAPSPGQPQCDICYSIALADPNSQSIADSYNPSTGITQFHKLFIDTANCRTCYFTYSIKSNSCTIIPNLVITMEEPFKFKFTSTSTGNGTPNSHTWQLSRVSPYPITGSNIWTGTTNNWTSGILIPGFYKICLNVCFTGPCGEECCATICYDFQVLENGMIGSISVHQQLQAFEPKPKNIDNKKPLKLVPNPTSAVFKIIPEAKDSSEVVYENVTIRDITGKIIITKEQMQASEWINLESTAKGIYFIDVKWNKQLYTMQLLLE